MPFTIYPSRLQGSLALPASKSLAHRALICAGLARGLSRISPVSLSEDMRATIGCMKALGASITVQQKTCLVEGTTDLMGPRKSSLNCFHSGSTLRFLIPVAALSSEKSVFLGKSSLLSRPMGYYADLFVSQNLLFDQSSGSIVVQGPLSSGLFEIPGNVSSQFISGMLFAAPLMSGTSEIAVLPPYHSRSYVGLTVDMLRRFGITIKEPTEHGYIIEGSQQYTPADVHLEADYSQLSYFGVYAALKNALSFENLNPDSRQGDQVLLSILEEAGAYVKWDGPVLSIAPNTRKALTIDLADCPDLAPALFVLASFLPGESLFLHTERLRIKESDRIETMKEELDKFGVSLQVQDDSVSLSGQDRYHADEPVLIQTHNDHRIAMAMSVFALINNSAITLDHPEVVEKSYPDFFTDLQALGAEIHE